MPINSVYAYQQRIYAYQTISGRVCIRKRTNWCKADFCVARTYTLAQHWICIYIYIHIHTYTYIYIYSVKICLTCSEDGVGSLSCVAMAFWCGKPSCSARILLTRRAVLACLTWCVGACEWHVSCLCVCCVRVWDGWSVCVRDDWFLVLRNVC
jgi:hypothetical protein